MELNHFAEHRNLTKHCKSTTLQQQQSMWTKKKKKNTFYTFPLILPLSYSTKTTDDLAQSPWVLVREKDSGKKFSHICLFVPPNWMHPEKTSPVCRALHQTESRLMPVHFRFCKGSKLASAVLAAQLCRALAAQMLEPEPCSRAKHLSALRSHAAETRLCQHPCDWRKALLFPAHRGKCVPWQWSQRGWAHVLKWAAGPVLRGVRKTGPQPSVIDPWAGRTQAHNLLSGLCNFYIRVFLSSAIGSLEFIGSLYIRWMGWEIRWFHQRSLSVNAASPDNEKLCYRKPGPQLEASLP